MTLVRFISQELSGVREEKIWKVDASGTLKQHTTKDEVTADTSSDFLLRSALSRRGLALDIAKLCSYEKHELWVTRLLQELHRLLIAREQPL